MSPNVYQRPTQGAALYTVVRIHDASRCADLVNYSVTSSTATSTSHLIADAHDSDVCSESTQTFSQWVAGRSGAK